MAFFLQALGFLQQFGMLILLVIIMRGGVLFGPVFRVAAEVTRWAVILVNG